MGTPFVPSHGKRRTRWAAALLIILGAARIATTYRVFSDTADEAVHIGAGLDLFQFHRYVVHRENPPLPRVILAAAPWLGGMRFNPYLGYSDQIHSVFYGHGKYLRNLVYARVGNLVFFILAAIGVWLLAREAMDDVGALLALLLFTTQPVILGYSGLATLDTASAAGFAIAMLTFMRWLRDPSVGRALLVGLGYGFAILCKFSCIAFVPAACCALMLVRVRSEAMRRSATLLLAPLVSAVVIWAGYAFTIREGIPAPDLFAGIAKLIALDRKGSFSYACGRWTTHGWWWYFPLAVSLKTTLPTLLFATAGGWLAIRDRAVRWIYVEWMAAAATIIGLGAFSSFDVGVRYVFPVYIPITIAAAAAAMVMLRAPSKAWRYGAAALVAWHLAVSAAAHPDYFPYFNEIAGRNPSRYLVDSNLDWGQDALRLARFCRRRGIHEMAWNIFGGADPAVIGLPAKLEIDWSRPPQVPTALSETAVAMARIHDASALAWADQMPFVRVGKSIRVYNVNVLNERSSAPARAIAPACRQSS